MLIGVNMTETVTRIRDGVPTRDAYGNDVPGAPTSVSIHGCAVLPRNVRASDEFTDGRDQVRTTRILYAPAGTDLTPTDRIVRNGVTYEVDGDPAVYPGTLAHLEVNLKAVTG